MVIRQEARIRCGLGDVTFGKRPENYTGFSAELTSGDGRFLLRSFDASGAIPAPAEILCCAGKYLWDQGIRECPVSVSDPVTGQDHLLLCSTCGDGVTAVTAQIGKAEFSSKNIPIRFEKPLINDPVSLPGSKPFRLTALRFRDPYGAVFLETAGDCGLLERGREISGLSVFPQGAEVVFVYARSERELYVRSRHRTGDGLRGNDICASVAAAVAVGRCLPDTAVSVALPEGTARAVCTKDWEIFLTIPILS